ncbi:general secretion pathway protein GspN [Rhodanobacter sp. FW510-R12]|uniref:general secretion pathway protein GspN n=1 Tax=Rhodanobacter TaxID=75309 RepID=UPI0004235C28|nr:MULTISPECIES: general secretion pathway protein GspN [Rhodanobacter]TAN15432.1 MAG: general secretion pathway protein GspN [Rhodanobacter sp.]UJJ55343.1 general secretion pathway protein GspN [Rhodanobacter thiooxydans]
MNAASQRQLTPWLVALVLLLGAVLLLLLAGLGRGVRWDAPRQPPPLPPTGRQAELPTPVPLPQYAQVWQKPLFSPDRKPAARADGGSSLGDLELTGILLTPGLRMALLQDRNGDRQVRLREGETLPDGSVKLVELRPRSALFDSPAGRTELKLPAGAPIDAPRAAAETRDQPAGAAAMQLAPDEGKEAAGRSGSGQGTIAPPRRAASPAAPSSAAASAAERLRRNIQQRRAGRAAAAHEGEH